MCLKRPTSEQSDAGGPARPHWQLPWPARAGSMHLPAGLLASLSQRLEQLLTIRIIEENVLAPAGGAHSAVRSQSTPLASCTAWHHFDAYRANRQARSGEWPHPCRTPLACSTLWDQTTALAAAFVRLAAALPEEFRPLAETSLLMPTLVGPVPEVKTSKAVAQAIGFAAKHPAAAVRARQPLGILCHHLVVRIVEVILYARSQREHLERTARYSDAKQIIPEYYRPEGRRHLEECWALPELYRGSGPVVEQEGAAHGARRARTHQPGPRPESGFMA